MTLYETLEKYCKSDRYPMHMPGHKRNPQFHMTSPYDVDVTEVPGVDDLHHPEEILLEEMKKAAKVFGSEDTFYLINGSTCGILAGISATCRKNSRILIARNCHKAVYHTCYLLGLQVDYIYPSYDDKNGIAGGISLEQIQRANLEGVQAVVLTSPTYEGVMSEVKEIADFLHRKQIPLIVDEAHGAHLHFHKNFPPSAVDEGADLVIQSVHKTLPSLTQTSLLHRQGDLVDKDLVMKYLQIYETSSPSYVLMSSISRLVDYMTEEEAVADRADYEKNLSWFYEKMKGLKNLYLYDSKERDPGKIVVATDRSDISGDELSRRLEEKYGIIMEMSMEQYAIAMTSVADTQQGFERLAQALYDIDGNIMSHKGTGVVMPKETNDMVYGSYEVEDKETEVIPISCLGGRIAREFIYAYPPGVPLVVPGERVCQEVAEFIGHNKDRGVHFRGMKDTGGERLMVVLEDVKR